MPTPDPTWLVVTDLDATLLDHAYRWDAARPALEALAQGGHPVVLNSSKTLAEMASLARELDTGAPLVAENGGVVAVPVGGPLDTDASGQVVDGYRVVTPGLPRPTILEVAHRLREAGDLRFEGFADWSDAEVAERTGLSQEAAHRARRRHATEPIVWEDTPGRRQAFEDRLAEEGIRVLRGGRFLHLMGASDKADGLRLVLARYQGAFPARRWMTVALGDSPNDRAMLEAADVAVIVPRPDGRTVEVRGTRVLRPSAPGPVGWNEAVMTLLEDAAASSCETR